MQQKSSTSLEELFVEAKRAHRYALPMPRAAARRASPDDTRFYLRRAEAELREERFPLRGAVPAGQLHFPAPSREQHSEGGAFWSCAWTFEGVVSALRAGTFFVSGHHDFADRAAGQLALAPSREATRQLVRRAETLEAALHFARESRPRPSKIDPEELLRELLVTPTKAEGEVL